jgi:hypothetical protein
LNISSDDDRLFQLGESRKFNDDDLNEDKLGDAKIEGRGIIYAGYWEGR